MSDMFSACFEELIKISVRLTKGEKRRQALQFAGLGVTALPTLAATQSKIMTGRWIPKGTRPHRFLGAAALGGAFWGGALPTFQHMIARSNIHKSQRRLEAQRELKRLAPEGPATAVRQLSITPELSNAG